MLALYSPAAPGALRSRTVSEWDLREFCCCPLRQPTADPASVMDFVAEGTLKWLSWEAAERSLPALPTTREKAESLWVVRRPIMDAPEARTLVRLARRLHDLVAFHEVLHPHGEYRLQLDKVTVTGEMVVMKRAGLRPAFAVRLRHGQRRYTPDILDAARWLYTHRESGFPKVQVSNFWYDADVRRNLFFEEDRAERWLFSATAGWNAGQLYPNPGAHCLGCSEPCLKRLWIK